jgi:hypothetical protein
VNAATENGTITIGKSFAITQLSATCACRVRLYSTAAQMAADASRPPTQAPAIGTAHGVICDFVLNTLVGLNFICSPEVYGANCEATVVSQISYAVENLSGTTQSVGVTMTCKIEEA